MARTFSKTGRKEPSREVAISKAMSFVLRHAAEREGVKIDSQGYANVAELLEWQRLRSLKVNFSDVIEAVSSSDKQRYGLLYSPPSNSDSQTENLPSDTPSQPKEKNASQNNTTTEDATAQAIAASIQDTDPSHYLIRARQGHSIKSVDASSLLKQLSLTDNDLPQAVVHGTYHAAWPKILETGGLKCMTRNQIHFATGPPLSAILPNGIDGAVSIPAKFSSRGLGSDHGVTSGMRTDSQILIYIDLKKALEAGCPFWLSENGVVLSEGKETGNNQRVIGVEYFHTVVELRKGLGVLWANGAPAQKTPDWMLHAKGPPGKAGKKDRGSKQSGKGKLPRIMVEKDTDPGET